MTFYLETGRTFGTIKRFQTALLPIMYKLGVMSAVIFMTLFLAFKGVFIGTLILVLNLTFFAIKFGSYLKSDHHHGWQPPSHGWAPPTINHGNGWPPHKDVHLHIHNAHGKPDLTIPYSTLSNGWDTHSNAIEPAWSTSGYGHSGRALIDDIPTAISHPSHPGSAEKFAPIIKARFIEKRHDKPPTIVMAENQQIVTPYNYLNKQNQNQK